MKSLRVSTGCSLSQMMAWVKYRPHRLQHGRVVPAVGVAAPDVERRGRAAARGRCCRTRRRAAASNASSDDEVVRQRPVLGPHLLLRRLRLLGVPREVETSGGAWSAWNDDRPAAMALLRARLDLHVVRRIGVHQVDRRAVEQPVHVLRLCCCRRRAAGGRPESTGRPAA